MASPFFTTVYLGGIMLFSEYYFMEVDNHLVGIYRRVSSWLRRKISMVGKSVGWLFIFLTFIGIWVIAVVVFMPDYIYRTFRRK